MPAPDTRSVEERLERLEITVERLQSTVQRLSDASARREQGTPRQPEVVQARRSPKGHGANPAARLERRGLVSNLMDRGPQFWLSRLGIGLMLVGLAFLFNYAVEQGWLTPGIRVTFGIVLGAGFAIVGFRVRARQGRFSQVMFGGATATWYMTGFAAFQLLGVVSYPVAFGFMVVVTVFSFVMSVQQDEASLAVLGAVGGLGTPFFLYTEAGSVQALMGYTCLVIAGTSAIHLFKGWRSLLWTASAGAWLVVALGFNADTYTNRVALESGVAVIWLLCWLVPVARERLAAGGHPRWTRLPADPTQLAAASGTDRSTEHVGVLIVATAFIAYSASRAIWDLPDTTWGLIACGGTLLYALAGSHLRPLPGMGAIASAHAVTGALLTAVGIALVFDAHVQIVLWSVEAAVIHVLATRLHDRPLGVAGHLVFGVVGYWFLQRVLNEGFPAEPLLNARALADMLVLVVALAACRRLEPGVRKGYLLAAHLAFLGLTWRELTPLPGGNGIVTATWGLYGLGLLLLLRRTQARNVGMATMCLAVAKLVLFDLSQVDAIWRILLFLSFGGAFLAISYYIWKEKARGGLATEQDGQRAQPT